MILNRIKPINLFNFWLSTSILLVVIMVIVGGLTRLTDSGLSITEWEVFTGILPPLNSEQWEIYFEKYKTIPQFYLLNTQMSLDEFKIIFYWEYFHRLLGRVIGVFFIVPLLYFSYKKTVNSRLTTNLYIIFILICAQGVMGWYMVQSGLVSDTTVSHYRLSAHLLLAFTIISFMFWIFLNTYNRTDKRFIKFKKETLFIDFYLLIIISQIFLGALVSGLDAGRIYQTWPLMNQSFFPDDLQFNFFAIFDFDDHSAVQFLHRSSAYFILLYTLFIAYKISSHYRKYLQDFYIVVFLISIQVLLGIFTLTSGLNTYLASAHQITGLLLFFSVIYLRFKIT